MKFKGYLILISISTIHMGLCFAMETPRGSKRTIGQAEFENPEAQRARIEEAAQGGAVTSSSSSSSSAHSPMEIDQPSALSSQSNFITIISSDGQEFNVSPDVANSFETIKDIRTDTNTQEIELASASKVNGEKLSFVIPLAQEYVRKKNTLEDKELLDALENKLKELLNKKNLNPSIKRLQETQAGNPSLEWIETVDTDLESRALFFTANEILETANFLNQPILIELVGRIIAQKIIDLDFTFNDWSQYIPEETFYPTIAKYYYLLTAKDLPGVDPNKYGVSIRDLLDYNWQITISENELNVSNMHINSLEGLSDIPNKESIESLSLDGNKLTTLEPGSLSPLKNLIYISLADNKINRIEKDSFKGVDKLENMRLDDNNILSIEPGAFNNLKQLSYVILDGNKIASLAADTFAGPVELGHLSLDRNAIASIHPDAFKNIEIRELNLSNNPFTSIPLQGIQSLIEKGLLVLLIENNKLSDEQKEALKKMAENKFNFNLFIDNTPTESAPAAPPTQ